MIAHRCEPRTSYIDSNPRVSLANQMTALYDAREISYTTETPTTLAEATYYSDGANRVRFTPGLRVRLAWSFAARAVG